ncbi:MAG: GAF domain-containing protein [Candidatus Omnitrophica bacterium]|nr:GAF domain-containing protein [Candidatus Omnitrophota bacterium]
MIGKLKLKKSNIATLQDDLDELKSINKAMKDIYSTSELEVCLQRIIDNVMDLLGVEMSSLMLFDEKRNELRIEIAKGLSKDIIKNTHIKLGQGISGWIAKEGKPILIKDIRKDSRFSRRGGSYETESLLSVPLKIGDKVIGVMNVNNKRTKDTFNEYDLRVFSTIAAEAAVAIKQTRQLKELRDIAEIRLDSITKISHELRTPLTCIKESISLLEDSMKGVLEEKQLSMMDIAKKNVDRLQRLISNVLDFSKMKDGKLKMRRSLVDLTDIARIVVETFKSNIDRQKISLSINGETNLPQVWADADMITQVFTNLLGNAVRHSSDGDKIVIDLKKVGSELEVSMADEGPGIPKEEQERIFEKFHQVDSDFSKKGATSGLGLPITKEIIALHKGTIWAESIPGKGSKFTFKLPIDLMGATSAKIVS